MFSTSFVTTAPAAIRAFSPIVTPGSIVAFAPMLAPFFIKTGSSLKILFFDFGYLSLQNAAFGPMKTSSSIVMPSYNETPFLIVTLSPILTSFSIKQ